MRVRAYAKVNIGLDVTGTREDGYHLLNMVMQTVEVCDELELELRDDDKIIVTCNDPSVPTDERCLVGKAIRKLTDRGMNVTLRTRIPTEAGMGGGSSDAAAALIAVNKLLDLGKTREELAEIALKLGADVPYFIYGGTMQCEGIGEKLTRLRDLPECWFVIVKPSAGACTENIYRALDETGYRNADMTPVLEGIREGRLDAVASSMENVLESVTAVQLPVINEIKEFLTGHGALGASMTGSGSAVFGIFEDEASARGAAGAFEHGFAGDQAADTELPVPVPGIQTAVRVQGGQVRAQEAVTDMDRHWKEDHMTYNIYVVKNTKNSQIFC